MQLLSPALDAKQGLAEPEHNTRLLEGMAQAVSEKRYADVTIADIVRHARVSKRTFYEHFPDKEACFLATYTAVSNELLARIASAAATESVGEEQLHAATRAYFSALSERPPLVRAFLSEIHAAGPAAVALRRKIHQRFADLLQLLVEHARKSRPDVRALSREMAIAIVGGINELVLLHIEEERADKLTQLTQTTTDLIGLVLMGSAAPPKTKTKRSSKRKTKL